MQTIIIIIYIYIYWLYTGYIPIITIHRGYGNIAIIVYADIISVHSQIPLIRDNEICWFITKNKKVIPWSIQTVDWENTLVMVPTCSISIINPSYYINGHFRSPCINLICGRYLQFRFLKWPLINGIYACNNYGAYGNNYL